MGIQVEFNPELALRYPATPNRKKEECLPENMKDGETYDFIKEGQRNYWLGGEVLLYATEGNGLIQPPLAAIIIIETTHYKEGEKIMTKGRYKVKEIFKTL